MSETSVVAEPTVVAEDEAARLSDEELERQLQIQVVDASQAVQAESADSADEYIRQQTTEKGFKGFLKKIWYGNLARDYIRQRHIMHTSDEIVAEQNLYLPSGGSKVEHDQAMSATIQRVTSEYSLLSRGETNNQASTMEGGDVLEQHLKELVSSFASGDIDEDALVIEKDRLIGHFGAERHEHNRHRGQLMADNVVEVARNAKAALSHARSLDDIEAALGVKVADVELGVRTAASQELTDRIIDKVYDTKVGSMVNETTVATAAAVAIGVSKFTVRKAISAVGATVGIGVGTGVIAGLRESHRVKQERRLHSRQMAEGGGVDPNNGKRRQQMEETRYQTTTASSLTERLRQSLGGDSSPELLPLLQSITEAQSLVDISDERGIDLISYDSKTQVEQQRLDLLITLAEAKVALRQKVNDDGTLEGTPWSVDEAIAHGSELVRERILGDMSDKDKAFRHLQAKRVLASVAMGVAVGAVIGTGSQELRTVIDKGLQGVFEHGDKSADRVTELAGLFHNQQHQVAAEHTPSANFAHSVYQEGNNALDLPKGYHVSASHDLIGPDGKVVASGIGLTAGGQLDSHALDALHEQGYATHVSKEAFETSHTESTTTDVTSNEYIAAHPEQFTNIHRELWYDNDTPQPDQNELATWWGGQNNSGIDAQGNYVLNVSHMTPGGSFEGNTSANYQDLLANHQLALAVSLDTNNQSQVIMVPFDSSGNVVIPADNPVLASVFSNQGGHAVFSGGYAEVVQIDSQTPGNVNVNILGTLVGSNTPSNMSETVQTVVHTTGEHIITHIGAPVEASLPIEISPVVPLTSRKGLENLAEASPEGYYGYYYSYGVGNEFMGKWVGERSPRLKRDPNADLVPGTELQWYYDDQERKRGKAYLDEINRYIDENESLRQIDGSIEAIVAIPVAAASESENIYHTLSLFEQQDDEAKAASVILLNLNWPEALEADAAQAERIAKTKSEIARAQADFPDLKIAVFEKTWSDEFIKSKQRTVNGKTQSGLYGSVVKFLYDTAAFSMARSVAEGRRAASQDSIIITNDADTLGISRHYLRNYINNAERNKEADTFSATIRRGTDSYRDYPGYGVVSNFYTMLSVATNRRTGRSSTDGPNSAIRTSTYAAIGGIEDGLGAGADGKLSEKVWIARSTPAKAGFWKTIARRKQEQTVVERKVGQYVVGAQVDTIPDRLLGAYKDGKWIARGWDGFDNGNGYEDRSVSMSASDLTEDPSTDMDSIARRIEINIDGFATNWFQDPAIVASALNLTFGVWQPNNPLYNYAWQSDGSFDFKFTDEGKRVLRNRLLRDRNGQFDPLGHRLGRQLYNRVSPTNARTPVLAQSRLVS